MVQMPQSAPKEYATTTTNNNNVLFDDASNRLCISDGESTCTFESTPALVTQLRRVCDAMMERNGGKAGVVASAAAVVDGGNGNLFYVYRDTSEYQYAWYWSTRLPNAKNTMDVLKLLLPARREAGLECSVAVYTQMQIQELHAMKDQDIYRTVTEFSSLPNPNELSKTLSSVNSHWPDEW